MRTYSCYYPYHIRQYVAALWLHKMPQLQPKANMLMAYDQISPISERFKHPGKESVEDKEDSKGSGPGYKTES